MAVWECLLRSSGMLEYIAGQSACGLQWAGEWTNNDVAPNEMLCFVKKTTEVWEMMHASQVDLLGVHRHIYETQKQTAGVYGLFN